MSFVFELEVEGLTLEQAQEIQRRTLAPEALKVTYTRRHPFLHVLGGRFAHRYQLWVRDTTDDGLHVLTDHADWDAAHWDMEPAALPVIAATVPILAEVLTLGFGFRATWVGSEVRHERSLSADDLVALVHKSQLNEFTLYRVGGTVPRDGV